jgi:outer membrane protein assembly factor BamB
MDAAAPDRSTSRPPLRLWPGVVLVILLGLGRFVLPAVVPNTYVYELLGSFALGVAVVVWWLFFSRAPWSERLGALGLMIVGLLATPYILHESIVTAGMGRMFYILALPILSFALVVWAVATRGLPDGPRRASMAAVLLAASAGWALVRTHGFTGEIDNDFAWRWSETHEERLLASASDEPAPVPPPPPAERSAEWPGFRGPERDGIARGVRIQTDWSTSPPLQMWRRPIGPGWSSFAVQGDLFYTQEQRGDHEVVGCYRVSTGEPVWRHRDAARFWESHGGAGPRATPTLSGGRVYTFGATGILNALDAQTGAVVWTRNAAADTKTKDPGWGFCSSPLVVGDLVIVATAGTLAAYDLATGAPRWVGPRRRSDYSSPHLIRLGGIEQVLLLNGTGATSVAPADGKVLWEHEMPAGVRIVQPALTADGDVLVSDGEFGAGNQIRRIAVAQASGAWTVQERWISRGLKPNFNDYVVHRGHAFGFDGSILACIDLADGQRKWKGGRYGNGQLILLPEQDLLLVLSEEGELALVEATTAQFKELARLPAIEGKTWNHPVLVRDVLLVRNAEEMAAFRLALADR